MGNATLFGLLPDDWKNLASLFVTPAIALSAVYIFGIDLVKIPFVDTEVPYKISTRLTSLLAIVLGFFSSFATAAWLTLKVSTGPKPAVDVFTEQFFRPLLSDEMAWEATIKGKKIQSAILNLTDYDGKSHFRIFVNNHRLFGTHFDCMWKFQCKDENRPNLVVPLKDFLSDTTGMKLNPLFNSKSYSSVMTPANNLPISRDFKQLLHNGINYIDVFSTNSGFTGCKVDFDIDFTDTSGARYGHNFTIWDGEFTKVPFRTIPEERTAATCDQFRITIQVDL